MSNWKTFPIIGAQELPTGPGIYVILVDGEAVYVGQSMRLRERIFSHKFRMAYSKHIILPWDYVENHRTVTIKCKESRRIGDWAMWEIRLIHRLRPAFNKTHLCLKKAA